jgi:adenosylmethionine---8-amino-7-oxononanoate aminotransferase
VRGFRPLFQLKNHTSFFSDNGSTAIEVALKIAIQYSKQTGASHKKRIIFLEDAYHGDTFGAMSVSEKSFFTAPFNEFLFDAVSIPGPSKDPSKTLASLDEECRKRDVMAMIYEPLIQGASGMQFYQADTLQSMIAVCKEHAVLSIADEVFTGFGRTGTLFASNQSNHKPDIICLSKALTGGTLPLGLTIASEKVWEVFQSDRKEHMLLHGHSFTGNPLSCTAALASLDLTERKDFNASLKRISSFYETYKKNFEDHPRVEHVRHKGLVFAFDIQASDQGYGSSIKDILYPYFIEQGVLLRPLGNVIYMVPPVCITDAELAMVFKVMKDGVNLISSH